MWKIMKGVSLVWNSLMLCMTFRFDLEPLETAYNLLKDRPAQYGRLEDWFIHLQALNTAALGVIKDEIKMDEFIEELRNVLGKATTMGLQDQKHLRFAVIEQMTILTLSGPSIEIKQRCEHELIALIRDWNNKDIFSNDPDIDQKWNECRELINKNMKEDDSAKEKPHCDNASTSRFAERPGLQKFDSSERFFESFFQKVYHKVVNGQPLQARRLKSDDMSETLRKSYSQNSLGISEHSTCLTGRISPRRFSLARVNNEDEIFNRNDAVQLGSCEGRELVNSRYKSKIELADLFPDREDLNRMMIIGMPGIGKSELALKLVSDWAKGNWGVQFQIVFLIQTSRLLVGQNFCGTENRKPSLAVAIATICFDQLDTPLDYENLVRDIERELTKTSTLVILDGLEEMKKSPAGECIIGQAKSGKHKLLMISRPSSVFHEIQSSDVVVELSSLTKDDLQWYLRDQDAAVQSVMKKYPSLHAIAGIPRNYQILCKLLPDAEQQSRSMCPRTKAWFCRNLDSWMWQECKKAERNHSESERIRALNDLGEIALIGLEHGRCFVTQYELPGGLVEHVSLNSVLVEKGFLLYNRKGNLEFTCSILQQHCAGRLLAQWLLEDGEQRTRAEKCIQQHMYEMEYADVMSMAAAKLGEKKPECIQKLLTTIGSRKKEVLKLQHLKVKMKVLEEGMIQNDGDEVYDGIEKVCHIERDLKHCLKLGMKNVKKNKPECDAVLHTVVRLLHDAPCLVERAKKPLLFEVLKEVEKQKWIVDRGVVEALAHIISAGDASEDVWRESLKTGIKNESEKTRKATIRCMSFMGHVSKKLIPTLLDLLFEECEQDNVRDRIIMKLLQLAPEEARKFINGLMEVCKNTDYWVRRRTVKAVTEIAKTDADGSTRLAENLFQVYKKDSQSPSTGVIDIFGILIENDVRKHDGVIKFLLQTCKVMDEDQRDASAKVFIRVIRAAPDKATEIISSLLKDDPELGRVSAYSMVKTVLEVLEMIASDAVQAVLNLMTELCERTQGNKKALVLVLVAMRHAVKVSAACLSQFISVLLMAFSHEEWIIRMLVFCIIEAAAKYQPSHLTKDLIDELTKACKEETRWKAKLSAFEAASEVLSSNSMHPELYTVCKEALSDADDEIRIRAGNAIKNAASKSRTNDIICILDELVDRYRNEESDGKHGIIHCFCLFAKEFPKTVPKLQPILSEAVNSPNQMVASIAISGLLTVATSEEGNVEELILPLNDACQREDHSICFCALNALATCARKRQSQNCLNLLTMTLENFPEPLNDQEKLIHLQVLEVAVQTPLAITKEVLEKLLTTNSREHSDVRDKREEIVDRLSLHQLINWYTKTRSDLVMRLIFSRVVQGRALLSRGKNSSELLETSEQETTRHEISKQLCRSISRKVERINRKISAFPTLLWKSN